MCFVNLLPNRSPIRIIISLLVSKNSGVVEKQLIYNQNARCRNVLFLIHVKKLSI